MGRPVWSVSAGFGFGRDCDCDCGELVGGRVEAYREIKHQIQQSGGG